MPVIPATWEAEAVESLDPERQRLQWDKIVPLHSGLATERDSHLRKTLYSFKMQEKKTDITIGKKS